jgi:hypothetical protein
MPPVKVLRLQWGVNTTYATKRATVDEIEELFANNPTVRRNRRNKTATHVALGVADSGRRLTVAFVYVVDTNTAIPVTAWERS